MTEPMHTLTLPGDEIFKLAHEVAIANREPQKAKYGDWSYEVVLAVMLRAIREASTFTAKLGWEGARFTYGHASRYSEADKKKFEGRRMEIAVLNFRRTGEGPERTFRVAVFDDLSYEPKL
ncbi:hypothetical protein HOU02_gp441 [Caulobacter phage CcrBL9]|uniref:Uncharacterized protein n=1 Tax=Caulobacter phage CcrBL9 TaxID=2283270 RepID=A0A385EBL9_9CAUD|nr:hypothetical protein HOU02_gp441 [Caulobacter phage CcrBL9]AXQ69284.1 hypothetical protein CcrBL9_gp260c [Caulobacter phage CcrBL9]